MIVVGSYVGYLCSVSLSDDEYPDVPKYISPIRDDPVEDICEFYNIDVERDIQKRNDDIMKCERRANAQDPEKINDYIAKTKSDESRFELVKGCAYLFHKFFFGYFHQMFEFYSNISEVTTIYCPTMTKFKHSCVTNVQVMDLDNEIVIAKSLRDINENEEPNIAFKANYLVHARTERECFLRIFNTK
uniref:Uncharacterized protein n=1 Tax=Glossina brevipalpis TaxID=37001 RepID=A0A1A9WZA5_9MUSC